MADKQEHLPHKRDEDEEPAVKNRSRDFRLQYGAVYHALRSSTKGPQSTPSPCAHQSL